jgi:hypothetical protein
MLMDKCAAIKGNGDRCKASAIPGEQWCWNHHLAYADQRKANARKGGKRGGRGRPVQELGALRAENAELRDTLLKGELDPRIAAVAGQLINTDARLIDLTLKAKEQLELEERMSALEERLKGGPRSWRGA